MKRTTRDILRFMIKALAITLPVLVPAVVCFIWADPFMVFGSADRFYPDPAEHKARVGLNKGMVSVRNYEERLKEGNRYNAFIFGSSLSCYYDAREWVKYLGADSASVSPYHFDSSGEVLEQLAAKIDYLDRSGAQIDHALIVLSPLVVQGHNENKNPMTMDAPQYRRNPLYPLHYYYTFFRAATNSDFLKSWVPGRLVGEPLQVGNNPVFEPQPIVYDPLTNQESMPQWENMISTNPAEFYSRYPLMEPPKEITVGTRSLTGQREKLLRDMARIFAGHNTDLRIIIGPTREKLVLNPEDKKTLIDIFGPDVVKDFSLSHVNDLETDTLMYDNTHYRPVYADRLMEQTYGDRIKTVRK